MISCGIQCLICDYPIHLDTYSGCSHACRYCFANEKQSIANIKPLNNANALKSFISGKRTSETRFCDWDIPIHWGANSDPFQSCELEYKRSLECLQIFADAKYPFIVSTKNPVMLTKEPYLSLISRCDCVLQISMACAKYDKLETGTPTYKERLQAAEYLSDRVQRIIVRVQPFFPDVFEDILQEIPNYAKVGIYGISTGAYCSRKKQKGMEKDGGKYRFSLDKLAPMFKAMKEICHESGIRFFCTEDGLHFLSDDLTCCGTEGLPTFKPCKYNLPHLAYEPDITHPTAAMTKAGTSRPYRTIRQSQAWEMHIKGKSYAEMMQEYEADYTIWALAMQDKFRE